MTTATFTMPRDLFLGTFVEVFGIDNMDIYLSRLWRIAIDEYSNHVVGDFIITWIEKDNMWYITHLPSLVTISWEILDNIGKNNKMSQQLSVEDLEEFVTQLKISLDLHKYQGV